MPINRISNWESHIERPNTDYEEYYKFMGWPVEEYNDKVENNYTVSDEDVTFYERLSDDAISRFSE